MKLKRYHLLLIMVFILLMGCSPKSSYMVLSFFFDGVPDYTKKEAGPAKDSTLIVKNTPVLTSKTIPPEINFIYHKPYADRNCNACHEKGVNNRSLNDQPGICYACHKDFKLSYQYVHGPVAGGYCTVCHNPHKGEIPKLLKKQGQQLCLQCHTLQQIMQNTAHSNIGNNDCTSCHNPHGGANRYVLK